MINQGESQSSYSLEREAFAKNVVLSAFQKYLLEVGITGARVQIVGSVALGWAKENSDIDMCIWMEDGKGHEVTGARKLELVTKAWDWFCRERSTMEYDVEPFFCRPSEECARTSPKEEWEI